MNIHLFDTYCGSNNTTTFSPVIWELIARGIVARPEWDSLGLGQYTSCIYFLLTPIMVHRSESQIYILFCGLQCRFLLDLNDNCNVC